MANWVEATVIKNHHWNDDLFSLTLDAPVETFTAGQFTKLALDIDGTRVQRAYSYVNSPNAPLEIYATRVADGLLSPKLHALKEGDKVFITPQANGFFTLDEVPEGDILWLFATGTAIGPYLSILGESTVWQRFNTIVLVHAVRYQADLSYQQTVAKFQADHPNQLYYQPFVSRESIANTLAGRIPQAISNGSLEQVLELSLIPEHSQIMLCGNPQMVRDTREALEGKGFKKNLRRKPGQITMENYW